MTDRKKDKAFHKIWPVIKVLFPTACKKYPLFFVIESFKALIEIAQPFLPIIVTPLLIDELCTTRNVRTLVIYVVILVIGENLFYILLERCNKRIEIFADKYNIDL